MHSFSDPTTPRYQLPFEELPRGFVPFPERIVRFYEEEQGRMGCRFDEKFLRDSLEKNTLSYFYDGLEVAYRPADGGVEVLGVGWDEASAYLKDPSVRVVQG